TDSSNAVTVHYSTADGTATAPDDYTAITDTVLTIAANTSSALLTVTVTNDSDKEAAESVLVVLSSPNIGTIGDGIGVGNIFDNDPPPSISIAGANVAETSGPLNFPVTLSARSDQDIAVHYATSDGSATSPSDYTARAGDLTISA